MNQDVEEVIKEEKEEEERIEGVTEEPKVEEPKSEEPKVEEPPKEDTEEVHEDVLIETEELRKNSKRWGSREVEITSVELLDDNGNAKGSFKTGENITIVMKYNAKKRIRNIVAGIGIFRADGVNCYGTNTLIDKLKGLTVYKNGEVICKVKNNLLEGNYLLDVALHEPSGYAYDYYREVCKFNVKDDLVEAGIIRLDHTWKY